MILCSNIVSNGKSREIAEAVLKLMCERVAKTLGPNGQKTINATDMANVLITKDGYHLIKDMKTNETISMTYMNMAKDLSREQVTSVGDGSTSTIVAAYKLFVLLKEAIEEGSLKNVRERTIMASMKEVIELLMNEVKSISQPISDTLEEIDTLAAVSLNNNVKISALVSAIYKEIGLEGFIDVRLGSNNITYYEKSDGFQIDYGRYDEVFVNNDADENVLEKSAVMIFDGAVNTDKYGDLVINTLRSINEKVNKDIEYKRYCQQAGKPYDVTTKIPYSLTIIAPSFSNSFTNRLRKLIMKYSTEGIKLNFNLIRMMGNTEFDRDVIYDLSIMTGAHLILHEEIEEVTPEKLNSYLGWADRIVSTKKTTTFYGADTLNKELGERLGTARTELAQIMAEGGCKLQRIYELKKRIAILTKQLVILYVGGYSEAERLSDMELIEDAVAACRSAIRHGWVIGGNLSIVFACDNILARDNESRDVEPSALTVVQRVLIQNIRQAFINVYETVLGNKYDLTDIEDRKYVDTILETSVSERKIYNLNTDEYTDKEIINSVETETEILKNVLTLISLILTSNQFMTVNADQVFYETTEK